MFLRVILIGVIQLTLHQVPFAASHPGKLLSVEGCGFPSLSGRVRGGDDAGSFQSPWVVAVLYRGDVHCTGTLITPRHVLTAGHCKKPIHELSDVYGTNKVGGRGHVVGVEAGHRHPEYDAGTHNGGKTNRDVWILSLARKLRTGPRVQPICISEEFAAEPETAVIIAGFGATGDPAVSAPSLKYTLSRILSPSESECRRLMGNSAETDLCIFKGLKSVCRGDSGGPAMQIVNGSFYQVGITSYGETSSICPHCACPEPYIPQVFARVSSLVKFIKSVVEHQL